MAARTEFIPGRGWVSIAGSNTEFSPLGGWLLNDGDVAQINATVSLGGGFELTLEYTLPTLQTDSTVALSSSSELTLEYTTPTATSSDTQSVARAVVGKFGIKGVVSGVSERILSIGVSGEPRGTFSGGPQPKDGIASVIGRFGIRGQVSGVHAASADVVGHFGIRGRVQGTAVFTGGGTSVTRAVVGRFGIRGRVDRVVGHTTDVIGRFGIRGEVTGIATFPNDPGGGGGNGTLTADTILAIAEQVAATLNIAPPPGMVNLIVQRFLEEYNDEIVDGIDNPVPRWLYERIALAAAAGKTAGFEAPQGAWLQEAGKVRTILSPDGKPRIIDVSDGTANRGDVTIDGSD